MEKGNSTFQILGGFGTFATSLPVSTTYET